MNSDADLEIWKGVFKVVDIALEAGKGDCRISFFSKGVWGHAPPANNLAIFWAI